MTNGLLPRLKNSLGRFWAWERDGIKAVTPASVAEWLAEGGSGEAIVRAGEPFVTLPSNGGSEIRVSGDDISSMSFDEALARQGFKNKKPEIVLEMPKKAFLVKRLDIPMQATGRLHDILLGEVELKTPFAYGDILLGYRIFPEGKKARVQMALIRRDLVESALEPAGLRLGDISIVRASPGPEGTDWAPVIVVRGDAGENRSFARICAVMAVSVGLLVTSGIGAIFWRQSVEIDDLDAKIEVASTSATRLHGTVERANAENKSLTMLHARWAGDPPFTVLLEEISTILPDSVFLTDFRLSEPKPGERVVDIVGLAQSAVGLPLLFGRSKYFGEASLVGSVTPDPVRKQESFVLNLKVRQAEPQSAKIEAPAK